jgi:L-ribulose-5-phosphate 3-epimerase UlaE
MDANDVDNYDNFVNNIRQQSQHQNYLVENITVIDDPITISPSTSSHRTYPNSSNDSSNVPLKTKILKKNCPFYQKIKKTRTCTVRNIHTDPI